jgi:hypothetical protein
MNPAGTLTLSGNAILLSEPLTATIAIEGPSPLIVTLPTPLLAEASRSFWQIRPAGIASIEKLSDGNERWTQAYRLEPFLAGDAVPVEFAPLTIAGQMVSFPKKSVNVKSTVADANELRPLAGPEYPPAAPVADSSWLIMALIPAAVIFALFLSVFVRRRRPVAIHPLQTFCARFDQLEAISQSKPFAEALSRLVREIVEWQTGEPITKRTTSELAAMNSSASYLEILRRCDAAIFAGEALGDRAGILVQARQLLPPSSAG